MVLFKHPRGGDHIEHGDVGVSGIERGHRRRSGATRQTAAR
jgi:hypothetical protein